MYEIPLPETGCNVYHGSYVDNYFNGKRTRFYLNDTQLVQSSKSDYSRVPDGVTCINTGDLIYKPELEVYFNLASFVLFPLLILFAIRLILFKWWRRP